MKRLLKKRQSVWVLAPLFVLTLGVPVAWAVSAADFSSGTGEGSTAPALESVEPCFEFIPGEEPKPETKQSADNNQSLRHVSDPPETREPGEERNPPPIETRELVAEIDDDDRYKEVTCEITSLRSQLEGDKPAS